MPRKRLIKRSAKAANKTPRRRACANPSCGKPLGSTWQLCHECGGENIRANRQSAGPTLPPILPGVRAMMTMFDRRGGA